MSTVLNIIMGRCPKCGKGKIFTNKRVFPLKSCLKTEDECQVCKQKLSTGNDNAPGMNYALSVVVYALAFIVFALVWGIRYSDNSIIHSFIFSTSIVIICQPWLMRLSKSIYLYLFIKFR